MTAQELMTEFEQTSNVKRLIEIDDELYCDHRVKLSKDSEERKEIERWRRRRAIADKRREAYSTDMWNNMMAKMK